MPAQSRASKDGRRRARRDGLTAAGFVDVTITPTHQVVDGMHSAIIRASKPRQAAT